jgi:hypothetical protein
MMHDACARPAACRAYVAFVSGAFFIFFLSLFFFICWCVCRVCAYSYSKTARGAHFACRVRVYMCCAASAGLSLALANAAALLQVDSVRVRAQAPSVRHTHSSRRAPMETHVHDTACRVQRGRPSPPHAHRTRPTAHTPGLGAAGDRARQGRSRVELVYHWCCRGCIAIIAIADIAFVCARVRSFAASVLCLLSCVGKKLLGWSKQNIPRRHACARVRISAHALQCAHSTQQCRSARHSARRQRKLRPRATTTTPHCTAARRTRKNAPTHTRISTAAKASLTCSTRTCGTAPRTWHTHGLNRRRAHPFCFSEDFRIVAGVWMDSLLPLGPTAYHRRKATQVTTATLINRQIPHQGQSACGGKDRAFRAAPTDITAG